MLFIVKLPTPSLRQRSEEIDQSLLLSEDIQKLIQALIPTMYGADGIGLAAPQVGRNIRVCTIGKEAVDMDERPGVSRRKSKAEKDLILVNPVWERIHKKTAWDTEGCLSVPKKFGQIKRYTEIKISAWDEKGNYLNFIAKNFFARVIQHEVDHLDGVLFIDKAKNLYEVE